MSARSRLSFFLFASVLWMAFARAEVTGVPDIKTDDLLIEEDLESLPTPAGQPPRKKRRGDLEQMSGDFLEFGHTVAKRVDRLVRQKSFDFGGSPWLFQGLPLIFPADKIGLNLGVKIVMVDITRQDPHRMLVDAQLLTSELGRYKHALFVDMPYALDGKFRLTGRLAYDRDITFSYFGIGNGTTFDHDAFSRDSQLYQTVRSSPSVQLSALRRMNRTVRVGPIAGFRWMDLQSPAGSLLASQSPLGIAGGRSHYLGVAAIFNDTDFEPYPSTGSEHEGYFYVYSPWWGSDYDFYRATYTYRRYFPVTKNLTFAHRTLFETMWGNIPFYELGTVGGSYGADHICHDRYYRGFPINLYMDNVKFAMGFEARWDFVQFEIYKQVINFGLVPFVDFGRVWASLLPVDLSNFHLSGGLGARLIANHRFILRGDLAFSPEGWLFNIDIGHAM